MGHLPDQIQRPSHLCRRQISCIRLLHAAMLSQHTQKHAHPSTVMAWRARPLGKLHPSNPPFIHPTLPSPNHPSSMSAAFQLRRSAACRGGPCIKLWAQQQAAGASPVSTSQQQRPSPGRSSVTLLHQATTKGQAAGQCTRRPPQMCARALHHSSVGGPGRDTPCAGAAAHSLNKDLLTLRECAVVMCAAGVRQHTP
jgi:hypothetical protein